MTLQQFLAISDSTATLMFLVLDIPMLLSWSVVIIQGKYKVYQRKQATLILLPYALQLENYSILDQTDGYIYYVSVPSI